MSIPQHGSVPFTIDNGVGQTFPSRPAAAIALPTEPKGTPSGTSGGEETGHTPHHSAPIDARAIASTKQSDPSFGPAMDIGHPMNGQARAAEGAVAKRGTPEDTGGTV